MAFIIWQVFSLTPAISIYLKIFLQHLLYTILLHHISSCLLPCLFHILSNHHNLYLNFSIYKHLMCFQPHIAAVICKCDIICWWQSPDTILIHQKRNIFYMIILINQNNIKNHSSIKLFHIWIWYYLVYSYNMLPVHNCIIPEYCNLYVKLLLMSAYEFFYYCSYRNV